MKKKDFSSSVIAKQLSLQSMEIITGGFDFDEAYPWDEPILVLSDADKWKMYSMIPHDGGSNRGKVMVNFDPWGRIGD